MKKLTLTILLMFSVCQGCVISRPIENTTSEIQNNIIHNGLLEPEEYVTVVTSDGQYYDLLIKSISETHIIGYEKAIKIDDILTIKKSEISFLTFFSNYLEIVLYMIIPLAALTPPA